MRHWQGLLATSQQTPGPGSAGVDLVTLGDPLALVEAVDLAAPATVVLTHPADERAARTAVTVLAGRHPDHPVTVVTAAATPVGAVAALVLARAATEDAGRGVAMLEQVLGLTWSAVLLRDVSRLSRPNPTLLQHVRSLLPGSRFLVRVHPDPAVLPPAQPAAALLGVAVGRSEMVVAGQEDEVLAATVEAASPTGLRTLEVPGALQVFGREPLWQAALLPWGPDVPHPPTGPLCDGCGLTAVAGRCRFCSRTLDLREAGS